MKRVIISATSDLVTDQRVHKVAQSLHHAGYKVLLFGRRKSDSQELEKRDYETKRTRLFFGKGFLFYANYNIRLFFFLLFKRADVLIANDLDTLLPNFLISRLLKRKLIYDTHEYYTGVPELLGRPFIKSFWKRIEDYIFPKLDTIYTVNTSIARLYEEEYKVKIKVIRNLPLEISNKAIYQGGDFGVLPAKHSENAVVLNLLYETLKMEKRKIIIYQGAVNRDRGLEEMIAAMEFIKKACLLIIGNGDLYKALRKKAAALPYGEKILIIGQVPFQYLPAFTELASLGVSIEKPTNINYKYASPNKIVDYIHAGVPVLASRLVEVEQLLSEYKVGGFIENHDPAHIAERVNEMLADKQEMKRNRKNCDKAASELSWKHEEKKLLSLIG